MKTEPVWMKELGRALRDLREQSGLSQKELGKRIQKSRFTVNKFESGEAPLTVQTLAKICEILGPVGFTVDGQRIEVTGADVARKPRAVPKQLRLRLGIVCTTEQAMIVVPSARKGKRLDVEVLSA